MSATTDACKSIQAETLLRKPLQELHLTNEKTDAMTCDLSKMFYFSSNQARSICAFPQFLKTFVLKTILNN